MLGRRLFRTCILGAAALCFCALPSCVADGPELGGRTEDPGSGPDPEAGGVTVETLDSSMTVTVRDGGVYIDSLRTIAGGRDFAGRTVPLSLPYGYCLPSGDGYGPLTEFDWEYRSCAAFDAGGDAARRTEEGAGRPYGYDLTFESQASGCSYVLRITGRRESSGPFEISGRFVNGGGTGIRFVPEEYFAFEAVGSGPPVAWSFSKESGIAEGWTLYNGRRFEGTGIYTYIMDRPMVFSATTTSNHEWNSGDRIPMIYTHYERDGGGVYFALEWINGTLTGRSRRGDGDCVMSCRLGRTRFETSVPAGESFAMPAVYLGVYNGDVDDGSNVFKSWFLTCKAPSCILDDPDEPLIQEDMQIGLEAADYGIESIKWDYGWWSDETLQDGWRTNEGFTAVRDRAYLGVMNGLGTPTLEAFTCLANKKGLSLALYVLLKDTGLSGIAGVPTSVGAYGHPEWFSSRTVSGSASADLGNKACVEFYKSYLLDLFSTSGATTWRTDFEPVCFNSDKENRHFANGSDVQYWCATGFYELVDYLYENVPGFRYECCSSGGSMKDFATMRRAVVINNDDSADYMSLRMSFYDTSYCLHPAQIQLPVNSLTYTKGSEYYTGTADGAAGFRSQLLAGVMLTNWKGTSAADKKLWKTYLGYYKERIRPLIRNGRLYHVLPRPDGINWDGVEYFDPLASGEYAGIVMLWKPSDAEGPSKTVVLKGLDPGRRYLLEFHDRPEQNAIMTGEELMRGGFTAVIEEPSGSEWVWIKEAG